MKAEDFCPRPQPYSRALRSIAKLIETRESDRACVEEIRKFLLESGATGTPLSSKNFRISSTQARSLSRVSISLAMLRSARL